jgi:hypothetical protein
MKKFIDISSAILFRPSFQASEQFLEAIRDFVERAPTYRPTHWGFVEPMNNRFDLGDITLQLTATGENYFAWARKAPPKGTGEFRKRIYPLRGPQHAHLSLDVTSRSDEQVEELLEYLRGAACKYGAEYMFLDSLVGPYVPIARENEFAPHGLMGTYTHRLVKWLPDIAWSQILGPAYIRLFGLNKVMTAPAYKVEQLGPETVYLQLSRSLFDMHERYDEVDAVRREVKKHLDDNIFFNPSLPADHVYRTPDFQFP